MTESDQRREEISRLFGRQPVRAWVQREADEGAPFWEDADFWTGIVLRPEEGAPEGGVKIVIQPQTVPDGTGGARQTDEQPRHARWERIFRAAVQADDRHVAFLDSIPARLMGRVFALGPSAAQTAALDAALRSYPGALADDLAAAVALLSPSERAGVAELALGELDETEGILRGLLLAVGLCGEPKEALELGDRITALGADAPSWKWRCGLEALRLFNTRDAHMQIQRVALESSHPPVIGAARQVLLHIAGDLRVPVWEVQDELVPDCGLNEQGGVSLDFGRRRFELVLDAELQPLLLERPGHNRHGDLPAAEGADDPEAAAEARVHWDVVREQLMEAVPVQVHRFEEALAQQTRWEGARWRSAIQRHPLLVHLVPRAIWGTFSRGGRKLLDTFRIDADRTLWGPDDEPYELDLERAIGLVHPYELSDELRDCWGEVLADYEVVTMFPQIDRPVYRPASDKRKDSSIVVDVRVPGDWALAHLCRRGWHEQEGWGSRLQKIFRNRDLKAVLDFEVRPNETVMSTVSFERYLGYPKTTFQLRDVPEVVYSETLYELEQMRMPQETGGWPTVVKR